MSYSPTLELLFCYLTCYFFLVIEINHYIQTGVIHPLCFYCWKFPTSHHWTQSTWNNLYFLLVFLIDKIISPTSPTPLRSGPLDMDLFNSAPRNQMFPLGPPYLVPSARHIPQPPSLGPNGSVNMAQHTLNGLTRLGTLFLPRPLGPVVL